MSFIMPHDGSGLVSQDLKDMRPPSSADLLGTGEFHIKRTWPFPRFRGPDVETAYRLDHKRRFTNRMKAALPGLALIALIYVGQFTMKETRWAWFSRVLAIPLIVYFMALWAMIMLNAKLVEPVLEPAVLVSLVYVMVAACFTPDRVAEVLNWGREDWRPHAFMEAEVIVSMTGVLVIAGLMLRMTPLRLFWLTQLTVVVYAGVVMSLGSLEYEAMEQVHQPLDSREWAHVKLLVRCYIICFIVYTSRVQGDLYDRQNWAKVFRLETELHGQEQMNEALLAEQMEARRRMRALDGFHMDEDEEDEEEATAVHQPSLPNGAPCKSFTGSDSVPKPPQGTVKNAGSQQSIKGPGPRAFTSVMSPDPRAGAEDMVKAYSQIMVERDLTVPLPDLNKIMEPAADLTPNALLAQAMANKSADWDRIRSMAENITEEAYNLQTFFNDCVASFPELKLFFVGGVDGKTSGGRAAEVEYQRTIGALFAVYWLLRLHIDGKESFCFGVDSGWLPFRPKDAQAMMDFCTAKSLSQNTNTVPGSERSANTSGGRQGNKSVKNTGSKSAASKRPAKQTATEKRREFYTEMPWSAFEAVVRQAGCDPGSPNNVERIMAMLCLTAFHDIMKVDMIIPTVASGGSAYSGFQPGEVIHDHDLALGYVLDRFPALLPSFAGLPAAQQRSVAFTQGKLRFNHGWFVQAEAPPGAMLAGFKEALRGGAESQDIGFYFLHWFTDLSGATATPLGGAEKFVLKFPHTVLRSFIWSVPFLTKLADNSETAVMEEYLQARWKESFPTDAVPTDDNAVALMRLACMAQSGGGVVSAFSTLPESERRCLVEELSRTGAAGQCYRSSVSTGGPALLVYYSPAFLQQHANKSDSNCRLALHALSRIFLAARALWPLRSDGDGQTVTIVVGELRDKGLEEVVGNQSGKDSSERRCWVLKRDNDSEGEVSLHTPLEMNELMARRRRFCHLDFHTGSTKTKQQLSELRETQNLLEFMNVALC